MCARVANPDDKLTWKHTYEIDKMRMKTAQIRKKGQGSTGEAGASKREDYVMSESVRAAKPSPPCRQYNTTG